MMVQSGYHLSSRGRPGSVLPEIWVCIADEGQANYSQGSDWRLRLKPEQKMPQVLKTVASEEDKVEGSQTKIKKSHGCLPRGSLWSVMLQKARDPEGEWGSFQRAGPRLSFQSRYMFLLGEECLGWSRKPFLSSSPWLAAVPRGARWGMGLYPTHREGWKLRFVIQHLLQPAFLFLLLSKCYSLSRVWVSAAPWTVALPGSPVHGILQARILEWVTILFSRGSS